jgi:hypothetical protein
MTAFESHSLTTMRVVLGIFVLAVVIGMIATYKLDRCPARSR